MHFLNFLFRQLRHKKLVIVHGVTKNQIDTNDSEPILVMEYMKDGSLEDLIFTEKKKLDQHTVLKIAIDIAKGLRSLHYQMSIHQNLKCSNILVRSSYRLISSNGNSYAAKKHERKLATMARMRLKPSMDSSSISYMAPEILVGGAATNKADIYA